MTCVENDLMKPIKYYIEIKDRVSWSNALLSDK